MTAAFAPTMAAPIITIEDGFFLKSIIWFFTAGFLLVTLYACQEKTPPPPPAGAQTTVVTPNTAATDQRPNLLLILVDDMGYADLNINHPSSAAPTPHLNQLAKEGIRFTRHYTESTCSSARAALLTGRYPARMGFNPDGFGLPTELTTLPELFKATGYRTYFVGKWHLGHLSEAALPHRQGFDTWLGYLNQWLTGNDDRTQGFRYTRPVHINAFLENEKRELKQYPGHLTDVLTDAAIGIVRTETQSPWFMYLAYSAPHDPIQARADYAARFPATPAGRYHAMLAHLDDRIGDLLTALEQSGERKRTIVVFASDNGGTNTQIDSNAPFKGKKAEYREGGVRTPLLVQWPGHIGAGQVIDSTVSIMDIYPSLARLASLDIPAGLDGVSLFDADHRLSPPPARELFWDLTNKDAQRFGVLSADGRWRLYGDFLGAMSLYDLATDPTGGTDVLKQHSDIRDALLASYHRWETSIAPLELEFEASDERGHGRLSGDTLQRSASLGDFTIGVGITPDQAAVSDQVILEQAPGLQWQMDAERLRIVLHEFSADLPLPLPGRCTSVLLTGTFDRPISNFPLGPSQLNVYVDGQLQQALELSLTTPPVTATPLLAVGQAVDGTRAFAGRLSRPLLLNRRADVHAPPALTVQSLSRSLCAQH